MQQSHGSDNHVRLFFKAQAAVTGGSTVSVTVVATPNASCTDAATPAPLTVAWNMTIAETSGWVNQGSDVATSNGPYSALTLAVASQRTDTGLAFHRSAEGCRQIDVALSGETSQVELIRYQGGSAATPSSLSNITMHSGATPNTSNHHVKLFLKARAAVSQGDVLDLTIVATPNSSCTDARTPAPLTVSWNLTIATAAVWTNQGSNDSVSDGPFSPLVLADASSRSPTGLAFHQSSTACRQIDVALVNSPPSYVELVRYQGNSVASTTSLSNIHMQQGNASDNHARLFFKAQAAVTGGSTVSVTVVATPNASCTDAATPAPLTIAWMMTVAETSSWVNQGSDVATSNGPYSALTLAVAPQRTDTGLAFHRSADGCRQIDVALSGDTGQVELIRYDDDSAATPTSLSNITMHSGASAGHDHHVKLFLKARAAVTQGDVLDLTIVATPNALCTDARTPAPLTLSWNLTIATAAAWTSQGSDDAASDGPLVLQGATARTAAGLAFHQSSTACRQIDVALVNSPPNYVELVRYQGNSVASTTSLSSIHMQQNNDSDNHVRLFFKAQAAVTGGSTVSVTVVATPNASCTDAATPAPLTVAWNMTIAETSGWVNQGSDSAAASGTFSALTLVIAPQRTDTGLAFHRSAEGCRQIDVALSGDTGQVELIRYAGGSAATQTGLSS
ncbi:MAG: hypothetical protein ISN26_00940, partial [Betaproteobacteria bacterium AqS2]|nr:hypothetical protein [Betaproteobacteria bacterium AqS2]